MSINVFPVSNLMIGKESKQRFLNQRAKVIWLTGLSGSGKSAISNGLENRLSNLGYFSQVLDGDNVRTGINADLNFTQKDRAENIRRISEISKLFLDSGIICINSFISPTEEIRTMARKIIGEDDFVEIFINTPLAICEERDPKGLYKKARAGMITDFTGIGSPYEAPLNPSLVINGYDLSIDQSVTQCFNHIINLIQV